MNKNELLLNLSLEMSLSLTFKDRCQRILDCVAKVIPCDASALMRLSQQCLHPLATRGLAPEAKNRSFRISNHPRLKRIIESDEPVVFADDSPLPDPFDGYLTVDLAANQVVHSCMGCPLIHQGHIIGVLTVDSLQPGAFADLDTNSMKYLSTLAASAIYVHDLILALEEKAEEQGRLARDLLREQQSQHQPFIGESPLMHTLKEQITIVAPSPLTVLITGDTGTGKELVAQELHKQSWRKDKSFVCVNCAALPEKTIESELFGHTKGAYTGATESRAGKFELANGGTLFLDEVGELPLTVQSKLLRVIQYGEIQRMGSDEKLLCDVRVIAATNRSLEEEVENKRFRADLFHRLNVFRLAIPPLCERLEDIPLLTGHFIEQYRKRFQLPEIRIHPLLRQGLQQYPWPGNVRELENLILRMVIRAAHAQKNQTLILLTRDMAELGDLPALSHQPLVTAESGPIAIQDLKSATDEFQRKLIASTLNHHQDNWSKCAQSLGLHRSNLHRLAARLGLR